MPEISKTVTMRVPVPVNIVRADKGAEWFATIADGRRNTPLAVYRPSEAAAKSALAAVMTGVLQDVGQMPVMVIGGGNDYANHIHLIVPDLFRYLVIIVDDGVYAGLWGGSDEDTLDSVLKRVLDHVGGTPKVLKF